MIKHGNKLFPGDRIQVLRPGEKTATSQTAALRDMHQGKATIEWDDGRQEEVPIEQLVPVDRE